MSVFLKKIIKEQLSSKLKLKNKFFLSDKEKNILSRIFKKKEPHSRWFKVIGVSETDIKIGDAYAFLFKFVGGQNFAYKKLTEMAFDPITIGEEGDNDHLIHFKIDSFKPSKPTGQYTLTIQLSKSKSKYYDPELGQISLDSEEFDNLLDINYSSFYDDVEEDFASIIRGYFVENLYEPYGIDITYFGINYVE